jgi:hypothetical protein
MEDLPRLRTERLVLRPFDASDGAAVERLARAREVADTTLATESTARLHPRSRASQKT